MVERAPQEERFVTPQTRGHSSADGATQADSPIEAPPVTGDVAAFVALLSDARFESRYDDGGLLGRGGMGEVRSFLDRRIGREVAEKTLRDDVRGTLALERFVREARVQGQLEHPAVVPVYDLGVDARGRVFFTMKRIRGTALDTVLDALAADDAETRQRFSRRKLLTAFVQVCLAVDFAHSRGVLHRDLKPSNVMLGDYGEVHVLDWGLAKLIGVRDLAAGEAPSEPRESRTSLESGTTPTLVGTVLGTPGYMSPEQANGEVDALDARTDVYALGAILFEIVYREPLHPGPGIPARIATTVCGPELRAAHRAHGAEVPPDLEALCAHACALDPRERIASARALADAVERFLDGERDEERRKQRAEEHVARARSLAEAADRGDPAARTEALRELGRALLLDPAHGTALEALEAILTHVPDEPPPAARAEIEEGERARRVAALRGATLRHATWLVIAVVVFVIAPVHDVGLASAILTTLLALTGLTAFVWRKKSASRAWWSAVVLGSAATVGVLSLLYGAFVFVPAVAAASTVVFAPQTSRAERTFLHVSLVLATTLPVLLSLIGWVPNSYVFGADGTMTLRSPILDLESTQTLVVLTFANVLNVIVPGVVMGRFFGRLARAEAQNAVRRWYLRQLLPERR